MFRRDGFGDSIRSWWRQSYFLDTPQGWCLILAIPLCVVAAIVALSIPEHSVPMYLRTSPLGFLLTPIAAAVVFVRFGMSQQKNFGPSLWTTFAVVAITCLPFIAPYLAGR